MLDYTTARRLYDGCIKCDSDGIEGEQHDRQ